MRATIIHGAGDIRVETVPDPKIQRPTDALVRVVSACICGSDLWPYGSMDATWPAPFGLACDFWTRSLDAWRPTGSASESRKLTSSTYARSIAAVRRPPAVHPSALTRSSRGFCAP
jgi:hypothetical protein